MTAGRWLIASGLGAAVATVLLLTGSNFGFAWLGLPLLATSAAAIAAAQASRVGVRTAGQVAVVIATFVMGVAVVVLLSPFFMNGAAVR